MASLTAHIMVRNEPFVWYAVRSVYPHVDKILLWDTGSDDERTRVDICNLADDDADRKIDVRFVRVDVDETRWNTRDWHKLRVDSAGKYTKGVVRREMIEATTTDWFMIVDGDEVHYNQTMKAVRGAIERAPRQVLCYGLPLIWLDTLSTYFRRNTSGRVFRTDGVGMITLSPNELHTIKGTSRPIKKGMKQRRDLRAKPYAHFETFLKPWRRDVPPENVKPYEWALPQVMVDHPERMRRITKERAGA